MNKYDEQIIVVDRESIFSHEKNAFNGFISIEDQRALEIFETLSKYQVKRRGDMEETPEFKQLISYCVLENQEDELLVYKRLTGGGEERLHGLSSIGVGGHMNQLEGGDIERVLIENARRELEEEVGLTDIPDSDLELIGFINDDGDEVGRVHIGLVFRICVDRHDVSAVETDTLSIQWMVKNRLMEVPTYETWSRLIIEAMYMTGH
ncbi:DNA mismatch repair protein MutT [Macrococcus brunensis]|uniref:DNA mismatch repair protein MutT n=1 Tax=Macrococcus brunensis TaxID=198483 RepID=A0A4R6BCU8_9STAP|nr:NUDIX domain-containing protein [Macrococcus brunensis]TDL96673.1 DNA mismatch repair protein MutT [Macrococcus brunensis]ULG71251.1 NUDIX domain-containing protein [Macrococcus brunensis]ULG73561.1 NUDIX domain-containing protein [Macrococcus brunensis]